MTDIECKHGHYEGMTMNEMIAISCHLFPDH